jgi:predicted phage gp36 major capsid-like protein
MKCPFCDHILEDAWVKKMGASLMGKASGESKARGHSVTSQAAAKRWSMRDQLLKAEAENKRLREQMKKKKTK